MLSTKRVLSCAVGAILAAAAGTSSVHAQAFLSEIFINPPGTDNGFEALELTGTPGQSLSGWYILMIDGDSSNAGSVDQVINLSSQSIGANGLLLLRDAASPLVPNPDPATPVFVMDFSPDIENGTNTFVLGFGTPPALNADLDTDNDGNIDAPLAGFTAVDAVSLQENDNTPADNDQYADDFGGTNIPADAGFNPDVLYRVLDASLQPLGWVGGDLLGTLPGPFNFDGARFFGWGAFGVPDPSTRTIDPGILNYIVSGPAFGACCLADGTCVAATTTDCAAQSGTYQGDNTDCGTANCPQPLGACCFADGTCQSLTAVGCLDAGGVFRGNFSTCGETTCPVAAPSASFISEILFNGPGGADQGQEYIEITGPAGASLDGWWVIIIEGDLGVSGAVDHKISLDGVTLGSNGVAIVRDTADVLLPSPAPETNVIVRDFAPDLENGSSTIILGYGIFPVALTTDLDANDDGTLDGPLPSSFTIVDAVGFVDGDNDGVLYADEIPGGTAIARLFDPFGEPYTPDNLYRILDQNSLPLAWAGGDILGAAPGPFNLDPIQNFGYADYGLDVNTFVLDPGSLNYQFTVTPVCQCDIDSSGNVTSQDFFDFLTGFFGGTLDYNGDGNVTSQDFFDFLSCFFNPPSGC
ncbi:MAG: hypothetical protein H7210_12320 [Pyrinomonadaceae bacterium]|nr:hypothetical protein [Phycisphaerales bacterium]